MLGIIDFTGESTMSILFLLILACADLANRVGADSLGDIQDYCNKDSFFEPTCGEDEAIIIKHARYGRMRESRCISKEGRMGCSEDVMEFLQLQCSGRQSCQVVIAAIPQADDPPCGIDLNGYLEVAHICVKVVKGPFQSCNMKRALEVREPRGYLSSFVKERWGCGSSDNPWWISVNPGQQLRLRLLYFGPLVHSRANVCHVLALIKERESQHTESVCAGESRESVVYTSMTNKLEVVFMTSNGQQEYTNYFLIEFDAIGCPDPVTPPNGWIERSGNDVSIGCYNRNDPAATWKQHCDGSAWIGPTYNCTEGVSGTSPSTHTLTLLWQSQGFYILVTVGIVVCASLCLLVFALIYVRRHWKRQPPGSPDHVSQTLKADEKSLRHSLIGDQKNGEYYYSPSSDYYRSQRTWPRGCSTGNKPCPARNADALPPYATVCSRKPSSNARQPKKDEHEYEIPQMTKNKDENEGRDTTKSRKYYELDPDCATDGTMEAV